LEPLALLAGAAGVGRVGGGGFSGVMFSEVGEGSYNGVLRVFPICGRRKCAWALNREAAEAWEKGAKGLGIGAKGRGAGLENGSTIGGEGEGEISRVGDWVRGPVG